MHHLPAPLWFTEAICTRPSEHTLDHNGYRLSYLTWGSLANRPLILIHGGFANAYWYAHIAPLLLDQFFIIAINLSGHGKSDWKPAYSLSDYTDEIITVAQHALPRNAPPPTLVAHSLGARIAYHYDQHPDTKTASLVLLDPPDLTQTPQTRPVNPQRKLRKYHDTKCELVERFKLIPPQPVCNDYITKYIAHHSIQHASRGYCWQSDPLLFNKMSTRNPKPFCHKTTTTRTTLIYGQHSGISTPHNRTRIQTILPHIQSIPLPHAHHALMIDQPLQLSTLILTFA